MNIIFSTFLVIPQQTQNICITFIQRRPANVLFFGPNAGVMLDQRRRRWANINPTLGQRLLFAG